jgi:ClpP class serine protease
MHPFNEIDESLKKSLLQSSEKLHSNFINHIEKYRGNKIKIPKEKRRDELYTGDVWNGKDCLNMGLADGLGNYEEILRKNFPKSKLVYVSQVSPYERMIQNFMMQSHITKEHDNETFASTLNKI